MSEGIDIRPHPQRPPAVGRRRGGMDSHYRPEIGTAILARIEAGETVKQITADPRMPCQATLHRWRHMIPAFGRAYDELRAQMASKKQWARARSGQGRRPPSGRSTYTREAGWAVCRRIARGWSMSEVIAHPGTPSAKAIYNWLRREPEFRENYVIAQAWRAEMLRVEIDMARINTPLLGKAGSRAMMRRLRGRIGRLQPKLYRAREADWDETARFSPPPELIEMAMALTARADAGQNKSGTIVSRHGRHRSEVQARDPQ